MAGSQGEMSAEVSADEVVEHFFEGLDEDAFIANLQVVSAWDSDDDKAKSANQESALSKFKSYLPQKKDSHPKPALEPTAPVSAPLGLRRDPDKTKRDIEKDKVNKSKDNLIKKMVTGLIPPGMEMDNAESTDGKKKSAAATEKLAHEQDTDKEKLKSQPKEYSPKNRNRRISRSHSRNRNSANYRTHSPRKSWHWNRPVYKRERGRDISPRRGGRDSSPRRGRDFRGGRDDSRERQRHNRYRSRSNESPRRRKSSKHKEDFLTYLSKKNLNGPKYSSQMEPNYNLQSSLPYGMPSADTISVQYPPPMYPSDMSNFNMSVPPPIMQMDNSYYGVPPVPFPAVPPNMCPPPYNYANGYNTVGTFQETSTIIPESNPLYADLSVNYDSVDNTNSTNLTDNLFDSFKDSEEKCKLLKNCEAVVKTLKDPHVLSNLTLTAEEDIRQRDDAFAAENSRKEVQHCSPLNRDTSNFYNYTLTGDKRMLLVPTVMATIGDASLETPKKTIMKDVAVQTSREQCDKCQCRGSFKKTDASTTSYGKAFSKSVHSQVKEEDLASSKIIFTPNQNSSSEPQKPVSLTHMTPAQILVAELTAKAKSLQRSAVDSYRLSGNIDDQTLRFNAAFEDLKNERNFPYPTTQLYQNNSYKQTNPNNDNMSQNYTSDQMKKRGNKNNKHPW